MRKNYCFPKYPEPSVVRLSLFTNTRNRRLLKSQHHLHPVHYLPTTHWTLPTHQPHPSFVVCFLSFPSEHCLRDNWAPKETFVVANYAPRPRPPPPPRPLSLSLSLYVRHCRTCLVGTTIINRKHPPNPQDVIPFAPHTHHLPSFFSALVAVVAGSFFPLPERVRALLLLLSSLGLGFFSPSGMSESFVWV
jgi:hypothetical protein